MKRIGIKIFLPIKNFLKNLILKPLITMITKILGTILFVSGQTLIPGFSIGMKKCKDLFQTGFRNGGFLWVPLQIFSVLKFKNLLNMSKPTVIASSLLEIATRYSFVLNLESLGFYVGIFVPTNLNQAHSLSIWQGNSKSNGGPLSKYPKPKPLKLSKTGSKPKSPNRKSLQSQSPRYQFGPNLYQAQLLGPKLKIHFLQTQHTGLISKNSKKKQLSHCPNLQTQTQPQTRKIQQTAQPSSSKTKTCALVSPLLLLSDSHVNIFKSLCSRELTDSKPPRDQILFLSTDRFEEEWKHLSSLSQIFVSAPVASESTRCPLHVEQLPFLSRRNPTVGSPTNLERRRTLSL